MNRTRFLKLTLLAGVIAAGLVSAYLLGSYRTYRICEQDSARYRVFLNSMYLLISDQDGKDHATGRILSQANEAAARLGQPARTNFETFIRLAILGQPVITEHQLSPAAWALATYRKDHPDAPFAHDTIAFMESYPAARELR